MQWRACKTFGRPSSKSKRCTNKIQAYRHVSDTIWACDKLWIFVPKWLPYIQVFGKFQNWALGCEACDEIAADEKVLSASTIFIIHIERAQLQIQSDRDVYHCANHVQKHRWQQHPTDKFVTYHLCKLLYDFQTVSSHSKSNSNFLQRCSLKAIWGSMGWHKGEL